MIEPIDQDSYRRCKAHKTSGERCRKTAMRGGTVCRAHGGAAPQTVAKARQRLLAAADPLMAQLLKIAMSGESEGIRLRATMDALSRAGVTEAQVVKVGVEDGFAQVLAGIIDESVVDRREGTRSLGAGGRRELPAADDEDDDADSKREAFDWGTPPPTEEALSADDQQRVADAAGMAGHGPLDHPHATGPSEYGGESRERQVLEGVVMEPYGDDEPPRYVRDRLDPPDRGRVDFGR